MNALFKQVLGRLTSAGKGAALGLALGCCATLAQAAATTAGTLKVLVPSQTGFNPQAYTSANLKTVDFDTTLLTNTAGISQGSTSTSGGGSWSTTTTASPAPTGFVNKFARVASGTSGSSQTTLNFTNGTGYISFLWHLGTGDSDNTIRINLSNGDYRTLTNCPDSTPTCVGGYDDTNFFQNFFNFLFGLTGSIDQTQSVRIVYTPPTGVVVTSVQLTAMRHQVCVFWFLCSWDNRNLSLDSLSYDDNSNGAPLMTLDHVEVVANNASGLTCQANTFKVRACANAACTSLYTKGVTGNVTFTRSDGGATRTVAYSIASGSAYSGDLSVSMPSNWGSSTTWNTAATSVPAASSSSLCAFGTLAGSNTCAFKANTTGLLLSLPAGVAGDAQTLTSTLVSEGLFGGCTSPTGSGSLTSTVTATYGVAGNVTSATLTGTGSSSTVKTLTSGSAITGLTTAISSATGSNVFSYADAGPVQLNVAVTGLTGTLSGLLGLSNSVVTYSVPALLKIEPVVNGNIVLTNPKVPAGGDFQLRITALNKVNGVLNNFGMEPGLGAVLVSKSLLKPVGAALKNNPDLAMGAVKFTNGISLVTLSWDEVGSLDFVATLADYLGTGKSVTGKLSDTVANGLRLVPAQFGLSATPRCSATEGGNNFAFAYAGQPIDVTVTALNADGVVTQNYDGTAATASDRLANSVSIATVSGANSGSFGSNNVLAATAFANGSGSGTITYGMTNKLSAPDTVALTASDADVNTVKSTPSVLVRSGRIKLSNAFGSEKSVLDIPMQVQYWTGKSWAASNDSCTNATVVTTASLKRNAYKSHAGAVSSAWSTAASTVALSGGVGKLTLTAPGAGKTGTVDVELDLSASGANLPWLQSLDDACGANTVCNPKARASFGVYSPESKKTVNIRNVF